MAVHDMGNGSLYVWVKNVSQTNYHHASRLFYPRWISENNVVKREISDSLDSVLEPGSISHGKIEYSREIVAQGTDLPKP
jgi:hypothetical protein